MKKQRYSILQFSKSFPDNDTCLEYLFRSLYGKPTCPACKREDGYYHRKNTSNYVCACGKHNISPKAGTIFAKSDTDLVKWFFAMYLMTASKNGVSAKELERSLEVTYKTAWRIAKELRKLMDQSPDIFDGIVEVDETYVGGVRRGTRGRGAKGKTPVVEGFWSQMKRSINGTYRSVSPKHLQKYVDEFVWRYNFRASDVPLFPLLFAQVALKR